MSRTTQTVLVSALLVVLPVAKWIQLERWPDEEGTRQAMLVVLLLVAVAVVYGSRTWSVAVRDQIVSRNTEPSRASTAVAGVLAGLAAGASAALIIAGAPSWTVWPAVLGAAVLVAVVVILELGGPAGRGRSWQEAAVMWTVAPGITLWCGIVGFGLIRGSFNPLEGQTFLLSGSAGSALHTVVVIALGEEYLYRGLLLGLAGGTVLQRRGYLAPSASFALWHLPDEWGGSLVSIAGTLVAMFAVSWLALYPLRRLSRSLAGPTLLHAANNLALRLVV